MGVRYQKYRSIAIPLNIGIELSQVSRYFDIFGIEPALVSTLDENVKRYQNLTNNYCYHSVVNGVENNIMKY